MYLFLYGIDIFIQILYESEDDREEWYTDKESDEPEEVLWDEEYDECDKYRKVDVWRDDFWI